MTQATQNTRTEPTVGTSNGFLAGLGFGKPQRTHTDVMNDALQAFTDAEVKMQAAVKEIGKQIEGHREQAEFHQNKAVEAGESLSRIERVKARFANLTA